MVERHWGTVFVMLSAAACGNAISAPGIGDVGSVAMDTPMADGDADSSTTSDTSGGDSADTDSASDDAVDDQVTTNAPSDGSDGNTENNGESSDPSPSITVTALSTTSQSALAGTTVSYPPRVVVRDASGNPMVGETVTFAVTGGGSIGPVSVSTDSDGVAALDAWELGRRVVPNTVTAHLASADAIADVVFAATITTSYTVTVQYVSEVTTEQRAAFDGAAARWSAVVINELPNFQVRRSDLVEGCGGDSTDTRVISVDDVLIFASVDAIDGSGGILAQATPCYQHQSGAIAIGVMAFDSADIAFLEANGKFEDTILHEMGHVIGVGTLWSREGLVDSPSVGNPGADTRFNGENAILAYKNAGGAGYDSGVPVENSGQQGSADSHWRESVFRNELMSPSISGNEPSLPLSSITVGSLGDLGYYTVNDAASDPFSFASSLTRSATTAPVIQCATGTMIQP